MTQIIECIPNVSEGRRAQVVEAMAAAIRGVAGVRLLDYSADPSHNRSVFTFAGDAAAVKAAVLALYEQAVPAIDLRAHAGEHPRLGAIDVVPFVPIEGVTMAECVALAKEVGADLIVVGCEGLRGIERVVLGSVSERIVREAGCPVVIARPKEYAPVEHTDVVEVQPHAHHSAFRFTYDDTLGVAEPMRWPGA